MSTTFAELCREEIELIEAAFAYNDAKDHCHPLFSRRLYRRNEQKFGRARWEEALRTHAKSKLL